MIVKMITSVSVARVKKDLQLGKPYPAEFPELLEQYINAKRKSIEKRGGDEADKKMLSDAEELSAALKGANKSCPI